MHTLLVENKNVPTSQVQSVGGAEAGNCVNDGEVSHVMIPP